MLLSVPLQGFLCSLELFDGLRIKKDVRNLSVGKRPTSKFWRANTSYNMAKHLDHMDDEVQ